MTALPPVGTTLQKSSDHAESMSLVVGPYDEPSRWIWNVHAEGDGPGDHNYTGSAELACEFPSSPRIRLFDESWTAHGGFVLNADKFKEYLDATRRTFNLLAGQSVTLWMSAGIMGAELGQNEGKVRRQDILVTRQAYSFFT